MGSYTEFHLKVKLRKDTNPKLLELLRTPLVDLDFENKPLDDPFFDCERWQQLLWGRNWDETNFGTRVTEDHLGRPILEILTEFKNYDSEIGYFLDLITPYIQTRKKKLYIGYYQGENDEREINLYVMNDGEIRTHSLSWLMEYEHKRRELKRKNSEV